MSNFSNIKFSVLALVIGVLLIVIAFATNIHLGEYQFDLINFPLARLIIGGVGGVLIALSIYNEWIKEKSNNDKHQRQRYKVSNKNVLPKDFFFTLEDSNRAISFPKMIEGATKIRILSRTSVNLLGQYRREFIRLGRRGCKIELLFVDPDSNVTQYIYGDDPSVYQLNIQTTKRHLRRLKQEIGDNIEIRIMSNAPTLSLLLLEFPEKERNFIQVQLYFLHGAIGRDRPLFRVPYGDPWYRVFVEEFEKTWENSKPWQIES